MEALRSRSVHHSTHPSRIATTAYGRCLLADADLPAGTPVARFSGPLVSYQEVSSEEVCHAILIAPDQWLVPHTPARYINHSCSPNCLVNDDLDVVTLRPVRSGEELTISYNTASAGESLPPWDERWTFRCQCGSAGCQGLVNGWVWPGQK